MAVQIDSPADVQRLLDVARGRHAHSALHRFATTAPIVLVLGVGAFIAAGTRQAGPLAGFAIAIVVMAFTLSEEYAVYEVSPSGIERFAPFRRSVWRVGVGEIQSMKISLQRGWTLQIKTISGAKRVIPLSASFQEAIASVYPTIPARR